MAEVDIGCLWSLRFCRFLRLCLVRDPFVVLVAGMRKPEAEDVRRAVRKSSSKKIQKGADEGALAAPPAPKRLRIREAAPPVPKKPRTDKGVLSPSERGALAMSGERSGAPLTGDVVDLTASPGFFPRRAEADQGAPARPPAIAEPGPSSPSELGPSRPSLSTWIPLGAVGRDLTEAESLGEVSAFGDPEMAISLFQSILLPADTAEMSQCSLSKISDSVFSVLAWVSRLTLLSSFHCLLIDF